MIDFIKNGKLLENVGLSSKVDDLFMEKGKPHNIIGNEERGYIYYDNYRYGYDSKGNINELAIDFSVKDVKFKFKNLLSNHYGVSIAEDFTISSSTKINEFILFLNFLKIDWNSCNEKDLDYFTIQTKNMVLIYFSLHSGKITRIACANLD